MFWFVQTLLRVKCEVMVWFVPSWDGCLVAGFLWSWENGKWSVVMEMNNVWCKWNDSYFLARNLGDVKTC